MVAFILVQCTIAFAQTDEVLATAKSRLNLTDQQAKELRPLLDKRFATLRKLSSTNAPFEETLWNELLESRHVFETGLRQVLTADQLKSVPQLQSEFEQTFLEALRKQQLDLISTRLKLTSEQATLVRPLLEQDFDQKVALVRNYRKDKYRNAAAFTRALAIINKDTEANLKQLLPTVQFAEFQRITGSTKEPVPWLWGVVPAVDDRASSGAVETTAKKKRGEFVIAPIPVINPTLGNGLALGIGYLYRLDKNDLTSPPSITGIGGFRTSNGSRGFAFLQKFVLKQNKYRLLLAGGRATINYNFFGIGAEAGNAGRSIPIQQSGSNTGRKK